MDTLPLEILLNIVHQISELDTLANLLVASPSAWRLFGQFGPKILNRCLDSTYIDKDTKTTIRIIAYIREGCLPVNNLGDLRRLVTNDSITHGCCRGGHKTIINNIGAQVYEGHEWFMHEQEIFSPARLPKECDCATVRGILASFRRITFLTMDCLNTHLQRFRQLRPRCAEDPDYSDKDLDMSGICNGNPPSVPVPRRDVGLPTWLEEQAVLRAFWRLQFVNDLRRALTHGVLKNWDDAQIAQLNSLSIPDVYDFAELNYDIEAASYCFDADLMGTQIAEHSLILMALEHMDRNPRVMPSTSWARVGPIFHPPLPNPDCPEHMQWTEQKELSTHWSEGLRRFTCTFDRLCGLDHESESVLLPPFQRLGLPIWSAERLDGYGLTSSGGVFSGQRGLHLVTWVSILGNEDVARFIAEEKRIKSEWGITFRVD
ncbi:hypothetical protein ANO11243_026570 [Dothideomycetidae sp. 11243]|nr:hypothetical protein ANO11243_026570 [fungal sp. No.11243]